MGKQPGRANRSWLIETAVFLIMQNFREQGNQSELAKLIKLLAPAG